MGSSISTVSDFEAASAKGRKTKMIVEISNKMQWKAKFDGIKDTNKLLVIDFTAVWCGPCKSMEPKVEEFAAKYTDVEFMKVDVDILMSVSQEFGVMTLPAFVFVKKGKEIDRVVGVRVDELQRKIEKHRK